MQVGTAIVRQLVVESLLLAIAGGLIGVALARWSLDAVVTYAPAELLRVPELVVDRRVLAYALTLSLVTGVAVGLVPAMLVVRRPILVSIRTSGHGVTESPRFRQVLVVCQVAMTVVLLCGAGLLVRTVLALNRADNGLDRHGVLTMEIRLPGVRYTPRAGTDIFSRRHRCASGAARRRVGGRCRQPRRNRRSPRRDRDSPSRHPYGPVNERPFTVVRVVTPGYFRTLRFRSCAGVNSRTVTISPRHRASS